MSDETKAKAELQTQADLRYNTSEIVAAAEAYGVTATRFRQLVKNERNRRKRLEERLMARSGLREHLRDMKVLETSSLVLAVTWKIDQALVEQMITEERDRRKKEADDARDEALGHTPPETPPEEAPTTAPEPDSGPSEELHGSSGSPGGSQRPPRTPATPESFQVPGLRDTGVQAPAPELNETEESRALKVHLWPVVRGIDDGQGGVRRVAEGMQDHLPAFGIEMVNTPEEADLIATHIQVPQGWEKRFGEKPIVAHCHGLYWEEHEWANWTHEANHLVLRAIKTAHAATVPTEWVAHAVRRHTGREPAIIPHGIDADDWNPDRAKPGYVYWDKTRPDAVCDPTHMNTVAAMLPDVPFVSTFGDDSLKNVRITGKVPFADAKDAMEQASVYLATPRETFGVSILQAFASGVPVVGWRWGGQAEIVEEGVTGYLVRPFDWDALAGAIQKALVHGPQMKDALLAAARRYPWERAAEMYANLYKQTFAEKHGSPRTSIIVTAYNLAKYLPACLDSVLGLVDSDWECIVVDDNSPDACGDIADSFAERDPRFRVIHNPANMYLAGARNRGLEEARGRYVMALDADDMLPPHATNLLADALDADPTTHIAYGAVYFVGEDGQTPQIYGQKWTPGHSGWPIDFSWELQLRGNVIDAEGNTHVAPNCLPYSSMTRTSAARAMGGWRERCRTAEDADFWARLSSYGYRPRRVTDADCLVYRVRTNSMSQTHARVDHTLWFGWRKSNLALAPAGVDMGLQPRVPSLDPPGISVIIPVGPGHERIAQTAVDSLEAQTWRGWECVLVNDTGEDLPGIFPSWVRQVRTEGRKGPAHARNAGAREARARLLFWLDADDFLQPEALETLFKAYAEYQEWETVFFCDFFEDNAMEGEWTVYACPDWDPQKLLVDGMIGAVTMLVPRSVHQRIGGFDEGVRGWEDYNYQIALASAGVCSRRVAIPLWTYRKHTGRRREENQAAFDEGKRDILRRWPKLWTPEGKVAQGAKEAIDLACAGCRKNAEARISGTVSAQKGQEARARDAMASGLVPIIYKGDRTATHRYKSQKTQQTYRFADGRWSYVHPDDVDWLLTFPGFSIFKGDQEQPEASAPTTPVLQ